MQRKVQKGNGENRFFRVLPHKDLNSLQKKYVHKVGLAISYGPDYTDLHFDEDITTISFSNYKIEEVDDGGEKVYYRVLNHKDLSNIQKKYVDKIGLRVGVSLGDVNPNASYTDLLFEDGERHSFFNYKIERVSMLNENLWVAKGGNHVTRSATGVIIEDNSGEDKLIRRFKSGAVRSVEDGRPQPAWVSPYAIDEISKVMVDNTNDFGACNYMLGIDEDACVKSLCRHIGELQEAMYILKDMEQLKVVARSVGFNVVALLHTLILKEKGLYKERYDKTENVTVSEAKKGNEFLK